MNNDRGRACGGRLFPAPGPKTTCRIGSISTPNLSAGNVSSAVQSTRIWRPPPAPESTAGPPLAHRWRTRAGGGPGGEGAAGARLAIGPGCSPGPIAHGGGRFRPGGPGRCNAALHPRRRARAADEEAHEHRERLATRGAVTPRYSAGGCAAPARRNPPARPSAARARRTPRGFPSRCRPGTRGTGRVPGAGTIPLPDSRPLGYTTAIPWRGGTDPRLASSPGDQPSRPLARSARRARPAPHAPGYGPAVLPRARSTVGRR